MKITKSQLREIIKEEIRLNEGILDIIPYFKKKREEAEKQLESRRNLAYSNVKRVYEDTISKLQDPKYDETRDAKIKQCNDLVWIIVTGDDRNKKINWSELKQMDSFDWNDLNEFGMMNHVESAFREILKVENKPLKLGRL